MKKRFIYSLLILVFASTSKMNAQCPEEPNLEAIATCVAPGVFEVLIQTNFDGEDIPEFHTVTLYARSQDGAYNISPTDYAENLGFANQPSAPDNIAWSGELTDFTVFNAQPLMSFNLDGASGSCSTVTMAVFTNGCFTIIAQEIFLPPCFENQACGTLTDVKGCSGQDISVQYPIQSSGCSGIQYITAETDIDGNFCIDMLEGECVKLEIDDCGDLCSNSNIPGSIDLAKLQRYILGLGTDDLLAENPYLPIFGDVNEDGKVSASDLTTIRKEILGIVDNRTGDCIMFDPSKVVIDGHWYGTLDVKICDGEDLDLIVGVLGDVDGSCTCNDGEKPSLIEPTIIEKRGLEGMYGFSFQEKTSFHELILEFDADNISPGDVQIPNFSEDYLIHTDNEKVSISIYSENGIPKDLDAGEPIITIIDNRDNGVSLSPESTIVNSEWEVGLVEEDNNPRNVTSKEFDEGYGKVVFCSNGNAANMKSLIELDQVSIRIFNVNGVEIQHSYYEHLDPGSLEIFEAHRSNPELYFISIDSKQVKITDKFIL